MPDAGVSITFEPTEAAAAENTPDWRVTLEAEPQPICSTRATLADLDAMLALARSGRSARAHLLERCKCAKAVRGKGDDGGGIAVTLACLVWPSHPDLHYELDLPPECEAGEVTVLRLDRGRRVWVSGGQVYELPWMLEGGRATWHDPGCFDSYSRAVPGPPLRIEHARLIVDGEGDYNGLAQATGAAVGFRHELKLHFAGFDLEGVPTESVEIDTLPVTARWLDAEGEEQTAELELPIPACAKALLATCDSGQVIVGGEIKRALEGHYEVAYSACSGKVLGVRFVEPEDD